ncbi:DUF1616 domain-containing protein [Methanoculleus sp.]|uniref:DUF1616 domain-containing protein n=1 Tax=Methanoculleus sp. TaxID=90427 RepID=UPI0025CE0E14|nr:DUF1616 domain-containing protein [Methanoculleus sp.]
MLVKAAMGHLVHPPDPRAILLAYGVLIAITPLSGLMLSYAPGGVRPAPIPLMLAAFNRAIGLTVQSQKNKRAEEVHLIAPGQTHFSSTKGNSSSTSPSPAERVLSIVLAAALLVAAATTILIVVSPKEGEKFTEFYILGPKGKAADYPTEFMAGVPQTVIIGIGNHEYRDITYTVETFAVESRYDSAANQSTVISATLLDRFSVTVPHNQTVEQPYSFRIMDPDANRIEFLLHKETPPEESPESNLLDAGYRNLHLWLRVH